MPDYLTAIDELINDRKVESLRSDPFYQSYGAASKILASPEQTQHFLYRPTSSRGSNIAAALAGGFGAGLLGGIGEYRAQGKADRMRRSYVDALRGERPIETLMQSRDTVPIAQALAEEQYRQRAAREKLIQQEEVKAAFREPRNPPPPIKTRGGYAQYNPRTGGYEPLMVGGERAMPQVTTRTPSPSPTSVMGPDQIEVLNKVRQGGLDSLTEDEEPIYYTIPRAERRNARLHRGLSLREKKYDTKEAEKDIVGAPLLPGRTTSSSDTSKARILVRSADLQDNSLKQLEDSYRRSDGAAFFGEERVIQDALGSIEWSATRKSIETGMRLEQREKALVDVLSVYGFTKDGIAEVLKQRLIKGHPADIVKTLRRIVRKTNSAGLSGSYSRYLPDVGPEPLFDTTAKSEPPPVPPGYKRQQNLDTGEWRVIPK